MSDGDFSTSRDWASMDGDVLDAPPGWEWLVGDTLAHHAWQQTVNTPEVGWGPDPPLLLEALMGHFPSRSASDPINSWFFVRDPGQTYHGPTDWGRIPNRHNMSKMEDSRTDILYDEGMSPHPLRSKLHGQQYTTAGAMFTYEFSQWQGGDVSGFMRIPVTQSLYDETLDRITSLPFEHFQDQQREYRSQYAEGPAPRTTFSHPHFRPQDGATIEDFRELWSRAHALMARATRQVM